MKTKLSLLLALSIASTPANAATPKAQRGAGDTGGSTAGDLGPPVGAPIEAVLTDPPFVPPPTGRKAPATVVVHLEVKEVVREIAPGTTYTFWTYGGTVPGKFIRVRQGDTVEFHLQNHPDNAMPHNIDLHAVTGQGGGAAASPTAPGHESKFTFKVLNQGLYIYHCATAPVGMHVANGMYGLIYVEPPEGLPPVDREYYVVQGDFYTQGNYHAKGLQPFSMEKAIDERATYVLFNGAEGSMTGDKVLKAKAGDRVRLFVGNGGPNLVSSFHVIGEIFDRVYTEGGTRYQENVQTTLVPAGGSAIVEYRAEVPSNLVIVDHSITRAFNKGAIGVMRVDGSANLALYSGKQSDIPYGVKSAAPGPSGVLTFAQQLAAGSALYKRTCSKCHEDSGAGLPGQFPSLVKSAYFMSDRTRAIKAVLFGVFGVITVDGIEYDNDMEGLSHLDDQQVANVLTFTRNSFGNTDPVPVTAGEVAAVRATSAPKP